LQHNTEKVFHIISSDKAAYIPTSKNSGEIDHFEIVFLLTVTKTPHFFSTVRQPPGVPTDFM